MKRKLCLLCIALILLLAGCGTDAPAETASTEVIQFTEEPPSVETAPVDTVAPEVYPLEEPETMAAEVIIEIKADDTTMTWGIVTGLDEKGEILWTYTTSSDYAAQLDNVVGMELRDGLYYLVENGTITALDARDGSVVWRNEAFYGSPALDCWTFDEAGNLYIAGYLGPDLMIISPEGEELSRVGTLSFDYFWPYELWLEGNTVCITMEGTPSMDGEAVTLRITLEEGTFKILSCEVAGNAGQIPATAAATSYLVEPDVIHLPIRAFDGDPNTAWVEGVDGLGTGEEVTLVLGRTAEINGFTILPGYQKTEALYQKNGRPTGITLEFSDGTSLSFRLESGIGEQRFTFEAPVETEFVTVVIDEAVAGSKYEDTCISEITFF